MGHDHSHGDPSQYYKEQLLTIGVCGAFGAVTLALYFSGTLNNLLAAKFHIWVLLGGAALLVMSAVNAVAVWVSVGGAKAAPVPSHDHEHHDHDHSHAHGNGHDHSHAHGDHHHHDHAHDHDHDHDHHTHAHGHDHTHDHSHDHAHAHDHDHAESAVQTAAAAPLFAPAVQTDAPAVAVAAAPAGHDHGHSHDGHDHGLAPWRYAVLLLPVAIYFVVPLDALSAAGAKPVDVDASAVTGGAMEKNISDISFQELELAALYPENRHDREGKTVRIIGQYVPKNNRMFTLRRLKITCCIADGVPLNAVIMIDPKSKETLPTNQLVGRWVAVIGRVEFLPRAGGGDATTLILTPTKDRPLDELVKQVKPPANPYLN
jgi:hypothetical protein